MNLYIDSTGGIAGDMVISALVSLGADQKIVLEAIEAAINCLGTGTAEFTTLKEGEIRLLLQTDQNSSHLGSKRGEEILKNLFDELGISEKYRNWGLKALDILSRSEMKAHKIYNIHMHHHHEGSQAWLHEAQDIIIDIAGTAAALQNLNIGTEASITSPVSVGGGEVKCSHGVLQVPPPAVEVILKDYSIEWRRGPVDNELCTPTGAAILAALLNDNSSITEIQESKIVKSGFSRGSGDFPIPPLKFHMI